MLESANFHTYIEWHTITDILKLHKQASQNLNAAAINFEAAIHTIEKGINGGSGGLIPVCTKEIHIFYSIPFQSLANYINPKWD